MRLLQAAADNLRLFAVLLATVAVAFLALGVGLGLTLSATDVLATHNDPGTLHACVNRFSKVARIVEDPDRCAYYEELVEWQSASGASNLEARVAALEAENDTQQDQINNLISSLGTLTTQLSDLNAQVPDCLTTADAADANTTPGDAVFEGCNVHVRDGSGDTAGDVTGLGNLIVGYNEDIDDERSGSHNLVVGPYHSFTSTGGLVAGIDNTISGENASVSGGGGNTASGDFSSVGGGRSNEAIGVVSSVSGGHQNTASATASSVSGGADNTASDLYSSVSGGTNNTASGDRSSVSGGSLNEASGDSSSVSGGQLNTASGRLSSVSGGFENEASGGASSVSGGASNTASGGVSSVSGGEENTTSGNLSSISGGASNTASDQVSSVSGGTFNTASGGGSTVAGGTQGTAGGNFDTVIGDADGAPTFDGTTNSLIFDDVLTP